MTSIEKKQLCSLVSKANGEEAIGSAATFQQCLILELPSPWPRDAFQAAHVPQGVTASLMQANERGLKVRPQAILPDAEYSTPGHTRIIHYTSPSTDIIQYQKSEYVVPDDQVEALVEALLNAPDQLSDFSAYRQDTGHIREMLVCTHGTRDTCCGSFGVPIYSALRDTYAPASNGKLRIWRTSHTGGHRFAATLIDFPYGHYWGRIASETLDALVNRTGAIADLRDNYRGWSALSTLEQVVERDIWLQEGWAWLDYAKTSRVVSMDEAANRAEVEVSFAGSNGHGSGVYEAIVEQYDSVMTLPSSGAGELREEPLYRISKLIQQAGAS